MARAANVAPGFPPSSRRLLKPSVSQATVYKLLQAPRQRALGYPPVLPYPHTFPLRHLAPVMTYGKGKKILDARADDDDGDTDVLTPSRSSSSGGQHRPPLLRAARPSPGVRDFWEW